jgi:hypothetical protein
MHVDMDTRVSSVDGAPARSTSERLAYLAWVPLVASGVSPVAAIDAYSAGQDSQFFWSGWWLAFAMPLFALAGVLVAHKARSNIYHYDRRGKGIATVALVGCYVLLVGSPFWLVSFVFVTGNAPMV